MKNPRTENLQRGTIQKNGLVWAQLVVTLIAVSYNVRMIRARHDRMESDTIDHPLLSPNEETVTHFSLSVEQEAWAFQQLIGQVESTPEPRKFHPATLKRLQRSHQKRGAVSPAQGG